MAPGKTMFALVTVSTLCYACAMPPEGQSYTPEQQAQASCQFFSTKMMSGAAIGAAAGAGAGALSSQKRRGQNAAIGGVLGALAGGLIGASLDGKDCQAAKNAMQRAAASRVGTQVAWRNPESGNSGTITATSAPVQRPSGQLCRSYSQNVVLKDGTSRQEEGTVCRDGNGDWSPIA